MLANLIRFHTPEGARATKAKGGVEHHLTEGAVMVAFAMHLLRTVEGMQHVAIHPDGEHAKHFPFAEWLAAQGFERVEAKGTTAYGGLYRDVHDRTVLVNPKSGVGDVAADIDGRSYIAECKGGVINSTHAGQLSRLRKGLSETVGLSLAAERIEGRRQFAVVPNTPTTAALAAKMSARARAAGIEIALVGADGRVEDVP